MHAENLHLQVSISESLVLLKRQKMSRLNIGLHKDLASKLGVCAICDEDYYGSSDSQLWVTLQVLFFFFYCRSKQTKGHQMHRSNFILPYIFLSSQYVFDIYMEG